MDKERVLVLCTGNSCRSQMAEGWLRTLYPDRLEAFSAGAAPAERVHSLAVRVMAEVGVDLSSAVPKSITEFLGLSFDRVLTTCDSASEACPIFPGRAMRFHRDFFDPATAGGSSDEQLITFRRVRDEIRDWLVSIF
jgi:arsenate reductase